MIEPFISPGQSEAEVISGLITKLNEVITELNLSLPSEESTFETELNDLIDTWKKEAIELEEHPELFHGFSREVCTAIARNKIHCCAELLKLIEEYL